MTVRTRRLNTGGPISPLILILIPIGTLDTVLVHPREIFRIAIVAAASAIVMMHNHPSGETEPSKADIKVTRDLIRAGQLLKVEICDHVIVGNGKDASLRALGYCAELNNAQ